MLFRHSQKLTKHSSSLLRNHIHGLFYSAFSLASSPTHVVSGAPADVADVTGAADLVFTTPGSSTVKPLTDPTLLQPRVVIYDGVCHLCHGGVKWVIGVDKYRKIKFCCLQSKTAEPYLALCGLDREDVRRRFVFVEGLGLYHQASTGKRNSNQNCDDSQFGSSWGSGMRKKENYLSGGCLLIIFFLLLSCTTHVCLRGMQ
ncbi:hypothetical protein Pint_23062 [Pistacia integerrima]|uniref:Uncharacterized protein n=1 Tax=Pistacia integerrima TaxID=434235 RepID=A0ACC0YMG3_9ROSI|nr:hypothetical protein Pint_23062 [Pistacia integerrima]